jgi:hypothetical protein
MIITFSLLQGCGKGPYRFADIDSFVARLDPGSLGDVVSDEQVGSEAPLNSPGRTIELLADGPTSLVKPGVMTALAEAGCAPGPSDDSGICTVSTGATEFNLNPLFVRAGDQLPSGTEVPPGLTGVYLNMGY